VKALTNWLARQNGFLVSYDHGPEYLCCDAMVSDGRFAHFPVDGERVHVHEVVAIRPDIDGILLTLDGEHTLLLSIWFMPEHQALVDDWNARKNAPLVQQAMVGVLS
jgi:hypothetical protein